MHITVGTDIIDIHRFIEFADDCRHPTLRRIFTQQELDYCFSKEVPESHLAARFAGKEAVMKALYSRHVTDVWYTEIEIVNDPVGVPVVNLTKKKDFAVEISLAHCEDKALAFVVVIGVD
jgi:holo-[acyl-carrier protein] synthase